MSGKYQLVALWALPPGCWVTLENVKLTLKLSKLISSPVRKANDVNSRESCGRTYSTVAHKSEGEEASQATPPLIPLSLELPWTPLEGHRRAVFSF